MFGRTKRERERAHDVSAPKGCDGASPKQRATNPMLMPHMGGRDPSAFEHPPLPFRIYLSTELELEARTGYSIEVL